MQFDSSRAFPYPVLRPEVDDYVDGEIQATVEFSPSRDGQDVTASVSIIVSVEELRAEVAAGRAQYVVVFACRDTYFRRVEATKQATFAVEFEKGALRGEVQVFSYICAKKRIKNFSCKWINPEFGVGPFEFAPGSVLAVDQPQTVFIDREVFRPLSSVFVLAADASITGAQWQVKPTSDKVHILVSPDLKAKIDLARNSKANRAVLMNSIYFSSVTHCVSILQQEKNEYAGAKWADVILQRCHNENINIEDHDSYMVTERLLRNPFQLVDTYVFSGTDS